MTMRFIPTDCPCTAICPHRAAGVQRGLPVEDFAIVIDTSMSCSGELVRRFLEETYDVLSETESYFKKVHLHIIQCDDAVRSDVLVTSQEELKAYMDDFEIERKRGNGFQTGI